MRGASRLDRPAIALTLILLMGIAPSFAFAQFRSLTPQNVWTSDQQPAPTLPSVELLHGWSASPAPQATIDGGEAPIQHVQFQDSAPDDFQLQLLPVGLLYKSYLAGEKEPRMKATWLFEKNRGLIFETALGGRVGILRFGNSDPLSPEGWQFDVEGAALARVDPELTSDPLEATDFRAGLLSTWRSGATAWKAGYYHLSSHAGDEFLINNPGFVRLNYVRDSAIVGVFHDLTPDVSIYGEVAYAFNHEDGAEPIELQYGFQYTPGTTGWPGSPFLAVNGHTRQDFGFITSVNIETGWLWRSLTTNRTLRIGMEYYDGPSMQWQFVQQHESLFGGGIWFDY